MWRWLVVLTSLLIGCGTCQVRPRLPEPRAIYDTIIFDIACVGSGTPSPDALSFFEKKIKESNISSRVVIHQRQDISTPTLIWNLFQVTGFETSHRKLYDRNPDDKILVIFISYLPGRYLQGSLSNIAGIQYGQTSFALFRQLTANEWEGVVLLHELGHILRVAREGLRREPPINPERPHHCNDDSCVMFWRADEQRTDFCEQCQRELKKLINGEKLEPRTRLF